VEQTRLSKSVNRLLYGGNNCGCSLTTAKAFSAKLADFCIDLSEQEGLFSAK